MTTTVFAPVFGSAPPFSFQPTLDGSTYTVTVTWNVQGQRWYANCFDLSGNLVFCRPLIGSTPGYPIPITAGLFASTMVYYPATATIVVSP